MPSDGRRQGGGGASLFEPHPPDGKHAAFRYFDPRYGGNSDFGRQMEDTSRLYAGFVFQKREDRKRKRESDIPAAANKVDG